MIKLLRHADLSGLNTFGLSARAAALCELDSAQRLPEILRLPEYSRQSVLWLGGGSNVLFMRDYDGLVVRMANKGIDAPEPIGGGKVRLTAQAGENWHDFVQHTIALGLSGLENLSLIPGTVGAAPVQNIGAYGVEAKDCIAAVHAWDLDAGQPVRFENAACRFAYRNSLFKQSGGRYVITAVEFALDTVFQPKLHYGDVQSEAEAVAGGAQLTAAAVAEAVCRIRRRKLPDPAQMGSCGSFYQNPIVPAEQAAALKRQYPALPVYPQPNGQAKLAAGWLIDQCGLKGHREGNAGVHQKQALVLVNLGGASAEDVRRLSEHVRGCVFQRFGVWLEPEPVWLG
ncbi:MULTISPECIES: UDP-N-acetylmuramate dehydrogenase [Eikenella]|uniref:UDP-N-acetylenolpyruvoylglucosamine reductase n=1 Tax=Eikenella longinqua TaxID=1795827 RepID=A0A1A9RW69_9NEIS|nr:MULTISPECIES: UDP-N-acetylmuramate dehydrogenase [Eikenella]OAM26131.1 UDP-N-acetylenolpyruvoylglucosamine reductase [Eikenella longinqua]